MDPLKQLAEAFEAKSKRVQELFGSAKDGKLSGEAAAEVRQLNGELSELNGQIKEAKEMVAIRQQNDLRLADINAAQRPEQSSKAKVEGLEKAGETQVEEQDDCYKLEHDGEMVMSQRQLQAISTDEYKRAFRNYLRGGIAGISGDERKALQEGADTQGGFLVPEQILRRLIMKKPTPTRVRPHTTQLNTGRDNLVIPRVNYASAADDANGDLFTTGIRITWTGEIPSSATIHRVTEPVFGQTRIQIYTAMMSMPVTNDMVEDSLFPIVGWSSDRFSETIELLYDQMILNGSGIGQPSGILLNPGGTNQPEVVAIGAGSEIVADNLVDMPFALPEQYDMNARWVVNKRNTAKAIRKLKDADNRYLWGNGLQDSGLAPSIRHADLVGYPVDFSAFMPSPGANTYPAIFGDLGGYFLVNRVGFSIQVLRELYAETNQILLLGRLRFGGQVAEPWRMLIGQTPS